MAPTTNCAFCNFYFGDAFDYLRHMRDSHQACQRPGCLQAGLPTYIRNLEELHMHNANVHSDIYCVDHRRFYASTGGLKRHLGGRMHSSVGAVQPSATHGVVSPVPMPTLSSQPTALSSSQLVTVGTVHSQNTVLPSRDFECPHPICRRHFTNLLTLIGHYQGNSCLGITRVQMNALIQELDSDPMERNVYNPAASDGSFWWCRKCDRHFMSLGELCVHISGVQCTRDDDEKSEVNAAIQSLLSLSMAMHIRNEFL
ncbi:hypothetical protein BKA70DRAFT_1449136 [Coprinopsis sp. MPI-PUGE-AT-0042]|nr:hypothetical protein BKA70DRAFT_1449136 [Coprinopsis sp. MPI-PUGE-AT-0042]